MVERIALELPETLAQQARKIAASTHCQLEEVLVALVDRGLRLPLSP